MSLSLGCTDRPLRVAIVGSGPSGFYAAEALFKAKLSLEVDLYERLPAPFGLVRYGVAPDHAKIKNVISLYEKITRDQRFTFYGNINIGRDVNVGDLKKFYDCIIFACGAENERHLGIPNETYYGSHTTTEFVGWYNGHPEYQNRRFDFSHPTAVIVGMGNVAMDVARILCKTVDELKNSDITSHALEVLSLSHVKEIHVIGRRGPVQAAFTPAVIREFGELVDCDVVMDPKYLEINASSQEELEDIEFPSRKKNFEILKKYSSLKGAGKSKKLIFHFLKSPIAVEGAGRLEKLVLEQNQLIGKAGHQSVRGVGQMEEIDCGIMFRSVGYWGVPIKGLPFDREEGIFPNQAGRLVDNGKVLPGLYAVGWIKRGATGIIGTNKPDSEETVNNLLVDITNLKGCECPSRGQLEEFLKEKKIRFVNYQDWEKINAAEIKRGEFVGKPREKFTTISEMLACVGK